MRESTSVNKVERSVKEDACLQFDVINTMRQKRVLQNVARHKVPVSSTGGREERVTGNVCLPFVKGSHLLLLKMIKTGRKVCTRSAVIHVPQLE